MSKQLGAQSIKFEKPVYILNSGSVVGTKEGAGPLGEKFDRVGKDDWFGCRSWEDAESTLQKMAAEVALEKSFLTAKEIRYLFTGDLLGQSMASSFGVGSLGIPTFGLYGACSTCGESLALGSMAVEGGFADRVLCVTSSHFASAEKEFRFPLDYGNQRPLSATWTVTGSGAFVLGDENAMNSYVSDTTSVVSRGKRKPRAKITGITVGKIVDFGLKDSMNMGACMAPAAASTIQQHFQDFAVGPEAYDRIVTGDLGKVGQRVLIDLLRERGIDIAKNHMDCGIEIYEESQDAHAGGSGCGCSAVTLSAFLLRQLEEGTWKKILFMPTGALLSKTSFNEGKCVPAIAPGIVIERV
ncbi:MAG: stage V sporulation protein AD [Acetatifactor sp.]